MEVSDHLHAPAALLQEEDAGSHMIGWMGNRVLDATVDRLMNHGYARQKNKRTVIPTVSILTRHSILIVARLYLGITETPT
jgi:hypothetical protein